MKALVAGVDGGGSKTRLMLANETGEEIATLEAGRSAMRPGEAAISGAVIADLMKEALSKAGLLEIPAILYGGFAGVGREEERRDLENELNRIGVAEEVVVSSDAAIALEDAFGEGPGIIVLAGTGEVPVLLGKGAVLLAFVAGGAALNLPFAGEGGVIGSGG